MQAEVDRRACLMGKRGGEEENVNTCMVPVRPAPKAARQQVAVASRGRVSYCSTVHNVTNLFELSDKGMFWKISEVRDAASWGLIKAIWVASIRFHTRTRTMFIGEADPFVIPNFLFQDVLSTSSHFVADGLGWSNQSRFRSYRSPAHPRLGRGLSPL